MQEKLEKVDTYKVLRNIMGAAKHGRPEKLGGYLIEQVLLQDGKNL